MHRNASSKSILSHSGSQLLHGDNNQFQQLREQQYQQQYGNRNGQHRSEQQHQFAAGSPSGNNNNATSQQRTLASSQSAALLLNDQYYSNGRPSTVDPAANNNNQPQSQSNTGGTGLGAPSNGPHVHQYADGVIVNDCDCDRGKRVISGLKVPGATVANSIQSDGVKETAHTYQSAQQQQLNDRFSTPIQSSQQQQQYHNNNNNRPGTVPINLLAAGSNSSTYNPNANNNDIHSGHKKRGVPIHLADKNPAFFAFGLDNNKNNNNNPNSRSQQPQDTARFQSSSHKEYQSPPTQQLIDQMKRTATIGQDYYQSNNKSYIRYILNPNTAAAPTNFASQLQEESKKYHNSDAAIIAREQRKAELVQARTQSMYKQTYAPPQNEYYNQRNNRSNNYQALNRSTAIGQVMNDSSSTVYNNNSINSPNKSMYETTSRSDYLNPIALGGRRADPVRTYQNRDSMGLFRQDEF